MPACGSPNVGIIGNWWHGGPLFWSFRIMVALGLYFIALFAFVFRDASHRNFSRRWLLGLMLWSLPLPWIAAELG